MTDTTYRCDQCGHVVLNFRIRALCPNCKNNSRYVKIGLDQVYNCQ